MAEPAGWERLREFEALFRDIAEQVPEFFRTLRQACENARAANVTTRGAVVRPWPTSTDAAVQCTPTMIDAAVQVRAERRHVATMTAPKETRTLASQTTPRLTMDMYTQTSSELLSTRPSRPRHREFAEEERRYAPSQEVEVFEDEPVGPTPRRATTHRDAPYPTRRPNIPPAPATRAREGCWNCGSDKHRYSQCKQPSFQDFCYRCGRIGTTLKSCPTCRSWWVEKGPYVPGVGNVARHVKLPHHPRTPESSPYRSREDRLSSSSDDGYRTNAPRERLSRPKR